MAKRLLILGLVLALTAALVGTAAAGKKKKKKKGPAPYTSEEVTIALAHPVFHSASEGNLVSVTAQEFFANCSVPASNGVDAWVFEAPEEYRGLNATIRAIGSGTQTGTYDLDIYMYDENCEETLFSNNVGTDETGAFIADTHYILIHNYLGEPGVSVHYELEAT